MNPSELVVQENPFAAVYPLPSLLQNSSTESSSSSPDASQEVSDVTKEVNDGSKEGKTFPKESNMNVTADKPNAESIDIMTRFIDMCLSNGGYDSCMGYNNKTKYMQHLQSEQFKCDGIFSEYKQPNYGKFTKCIYNGLKQLEELVSYSHASSDAEHCEEYPESIRNLVTKYLNFVQSRELSIVAVTQADKNSMIQSSVISVPPAIEPTDAHATSRTSVAKTNEKLGHPVATQDRLGMAYDEGNPTKRSKKANSEPNKTKNHFEISYEISVAHLEAEKVRSESRSKEIELKREHLSMIREERKTRQEERKMRREEKMKLKEDELIMKKNEINMRAINETIQAYKEMRDAADDQEEKKKYNQKIAELSEKKLQMMF